MAFIQSPPELAPQFEDDRVLTRYLERHLPADVHAKVTPGLQHLGELAAGRLYQLSIEHRLSEPALTQWDPWGNRVDQVEVSAAWREYARVAAEQGLVSIAYEREHGGDSRLVQFASVYLFAPSTQTYSCPLAMTDGAARTLELMAEPALKGRVLPHLISRDPDQAWTSGQWMTERTGGSDVGLSETVARAVDGGFRLYGTKWFTSAVTSEVALTLARPEGNPPGGRGLALFFLELRDAAGRLNGLSVNRLKEKLGTKHLPTAELTLDGTFAVPLAGLDQGIRHMANMLNLTRTWNAVVSVAGMRRGLALARDFARRRVAFGAPLSNKPLHLDTLAGLSAEYEAAFQLVFEEVRLLGRAETGELPDAARRVLAVLQPLAKLVTGKQAVAHASEVLECFGGAGYIEDTGLPALLRDAQVLSIWEGTTNVLSLEAFRAMQREDAASLFLEKVRGHAEAAKDAHLTTVAQAAIAGAEHALTWLKGAVGTPPVFEAGARRAALTLARSMALALLVEHAQWELDQHGDARSASAATLFLSHGVDLIGANGLALSDVQALALG
ncbi:MAG: acyl-CoA dehydrogenase family protein [Polyangiaceae bacterium]|nr:acyl-CoA dehydrogenase family protein [Polyangiaceae bacterium]MCW5791805.1 acyl-CoA dehydrogenase family protein [Polyangiaceae bacterium]